MQNPKTKSTKQLQQVAERSLAIGNGFYDVWRKTKDVSAGRLAISSYNTVTKANQTIIDMERTPTKAHNKKVVTARKRTIKKPTKAATGGKRKSKI